jgi:GNAT superfamily N-acetyltransferase
MTADYDAAVRDHLVDLLELDGQLAALIEMRPEADHLLIINIAVLPTRQGHGYGRALLATPMILPVLWVSGRCASTRMAASPRT